LIRDPYSKRHRGGCKKGDVLTRMPRYRLKVNGGLRLSRQKSYKLQRTPREMKSE
jgi:hypothetical protein